MAATTLPALPRQPLTIYRGARFRPVAWVVRDEATGQPARSVDGLTVEAKVRLYAAAEQVLHTFVTSASLVTFPGQYDDQPVAVAQIDEMSPVETSGLGWDAGVYDVMVNGELVVATSRVRVRPVASR